ncbi:MAG: hypothetical protein UV82_C0019G0001, partial [Candidatus Magasanikbacteria bacterium GW2011_GWD2_43_18]
MNAPKQLSHPTVQAPEHHAWEQYWLWHGMFRSYRDLKQEEPHPTNKKRLAYLKKQIVWQYLKIFFLFPIWFVRLLTPSYMKGSVNIWTNIKTIIRNKEFRPLRLAVLSQMVFLFFLAQFGVTVFYKHATPTYAATYQWVMTDWSGGASTSTYGSHGSNQTGWNTFFSKDPAVQTSGSGEVSVLSSAATYTETSDADFGAGTLANAYVASNAIVLLKENGVSCLTNAECSSGICNEYTNLCADDNLPHITITSTTFDYAGSIEIFTVPAGVTSITIQAKGGQGASGYGGTIGGKGADMTGIFTVTPGDALQILVGGQGLNSPNSYNSGSGGGGTFVYNATTAQLMIAAGGGGGSSNPSYGSASYADASASTSGKAGSSSGAGAGGTSGYGGGRGSYSGGGAGWYSNGTNGYGLGGIRFLAGGAGGSGYSGYGAAGAFGGGGGVYAGGGGGGGYSGGGAGGWSYGWGGGGGSYNGGASQTNVGGSNSGAGEVIVTYGDTASSGEVSGGGSSSGDQTETFSYTGSMQTFTVPSGVTSINIETLGASGGYSDDGAAGNTRPGKGAKMSGTFSVTPGQVLKILVGREGTPAEGVGSGNRAGGGGGGTFVTDINNVPLIVSGGGGGESWASFNVNGVDAVTTNTGTGGGSTSGRGGGGGGFLANGTSYSTQYGGYSFLNGGAGGNGSYGTGGYGGGGGAQYEGGGGGGYNGGGVITTNDYSGTAPAAAGSYNIGTSQSNVAGYNSGNGQVAISYSIYEIPTTSNITIVGTSSVQIAWNAVDGISYYTVSSTSGSTVTTTNTSYTFTGLSSSTVYYFQVATDLSGFSSVTSTQIYSGSYTSPIVDATSAAQFSSISWNDTTTANSVVIMEIRTGDQADLSDGTWTTVTNGGLLGESLDGKRYFQYRASLVTSNTATVPSLEDVTINYDINTGSFLSSPYDTGNGNNLLASVSWEATTSTGDIVKFQLRTSADSSTWTEWMGTDGTSASYFTASDGSDDLPSDLGDGVDDRWIQYKAFLTDDGESGLTLDEVTVTYVVNEAPEVQNVTAVQNADGTVSISYEVRDIDSVLGATPGTILPTVEYWNGGTWVEASTFSDAATSAKSVHLDNVNTYTEYSLTWYPNTDYDEQYLNASTGKIRVKANDSEAANNIGSGESATFALDTAAPVKTSFHIDARSDTASNITLTATDDTMSGLLITLSNISSLDPDGTNDISGTWVDYDTAFDWSLNANPQTVYYQFKDALGNVSETYTTIAPEIPQHLVYRDISNAETSEWREFIAWETVLNPSAGFKRYSIYRKVDGGDFELRDTEVDRTVNYYIDTGLTSGSTYSYKVTAEDNNDNISNYSSTVSDAPDGQGGSDFTSPTITNVAISDVGAQTATVTWDTDEPANSTVEYITVVGGDFSNAQSSGIATMLDSNTGLGQHHVVLTGLLPDTTYYLQVKSRDPSNNSVTDKEGSNGYSFTTVAGASVSSVSVSDIGNSQATVTWQSDVATNSYVSYSTSSAFSSYVRVGSLAETLSHAITVTGLSPNTKYYYYVSSGATVDKHVIDGEITYYNFTTTNDSVLPVITFTSGNDITNLSDTGVTISWSTNKSTTSTIEYGTDNAFGTTRTNDQYNTSHVYTLSDLVLGTSYYVRMLNTDKNGNTSDPTEFVFTTTDSTDRTPPTITVATTTLVSDTKALITWTTDEGSSSQVFYGTAADSLDNETTVDTASNRSHRVIISGLSASTRYYYIVQSADANGNTATSTSASSFTTRQTLSEEDAVISRETISYELGTDDAPSSGGVILVDKTGDNIAPLLTDVKVSSITQTEAIISWKANEASDGVVEYGYAQGTYDSSAIDVPLIDKTDHRVQLYDLTPLRTYYYRVSSEDGSNNRSAYSSGSFTTGAVD